MGAGAIGCFLGGKLAAAGLDVVLVGRERLGAELAASGLHVTDMEGATQTAPASRWAFATDVQAIAPCEVVLCCVKSAQSAEAGALLAGSLRPHAIVASMQNGVRNAQVLRGELARQEVLGGIVGFNVVSKGGGAFRQATTGPLVIEASARSEVAELVDTLRRARLQALARADIQPLQWSKLLMNLNNAISALSDRPTQELVFKSEYRRIVAAIIAEALGVLRHAGVRPARLGPLPPGIYPYVLRLPTPLLRVVARAQLKIDPEARSSMWEDLVRGRPTEVDYLNGEVVRLAAASGTDAPLNRRVVELVHEVEAKGTGSPKLGADALWSALNG
jgi:2-dehydropantoate 2-reductase